MAKIEKLSRTFNPGDILFASTMTQSDVKANEVIDVVNGLTDTTSVMDSSIRQNAGDIVIINNDIDIIDSSIVRMDSSIATLDASVKEIEIVTEDKMERDGSNYEGDLTLAGIELSSEWVIYKNDGTTEVETSSSNAITVERGSKVKYSGRWRWNLTDSSTQKSPTRCDGTWGTTLPASGIYSSKYESSLLSTNTSHSQSIYAPKSGLIVENNVVKKASGEDSRGVSSSVTFRWRRYFGASATAVSTVAELATLVKNLENTSGVGTTELSDSKAKTFNMKFTGSKYFYFIYPATLGDITSTTVGGFAFTDWVKQTINLTNDYGYEISYNVYRSNGLKTSGTSGLDFVIK